MSISRGLLGEPKVRGVGLGLAAAFALCDAACWAGIWKTCLEGRERFASFEGFWEGQKVRGLGLGWLPPSRLKSKGWDGRLLLPSLSLMLQLDLVGVAVAL